MKKLHLKELILLLAPSITLVLVGISLRGRDKSSVTVEKIIVAVEPPRDSAESGRRFYLKGEMDTRVTVLMKHRSPSAYRQLFQQPQWELPYLHYLMDEKGRKYAWQLPVSKSPTAIVSVNGNLPMVSLGGDVENKGGSVYAVRFYFPLRQIPKSAGKIVFKTKVVADNQTLPITVTVRER